MSKDVSNISGFFAPTRFHPTYKYFFQIHQNINQLVLVVGSIHLVWVRLQLVQSIVLVLLGPSRVMESWTVMGPKQILDLIRIILQIVVDNKLVLYLVWVVYQQTLLVVTVSSAN